MRFLIRFSVDERAVGPVLAALNSHDGVVFDHLAIEPLVVQKPVPVPKDQTHRERRAELAADRNAADPAKKGWMGHPKDKPSWFKPGNPTGKTGRQIVLDLLADGQNKPTADVKEELGAHGFAKGGTSSLLEKLRIKGEVIRVMDGVWALTPPKEA